MDDLVFILGLANEHEEAVGFIPAPTIEHRYLANNRFIIQSAAGKPVGYLLHGKPTPGGILTVAQTVIDYDFRQRGHGMDVMHTLIERAWLAGCKAVKLTCADDLTEAHELWKAVGMQRVKTLPALNTRKRTKGVYILDLWPRLF